MNKTIRRLYPTAINLVDFVMQDDGNGIYIRHWDEAKLGAKPTMEYLLAQEPITDQAELDEQANADADRAIAAMLPEAVETLMAWAEKQAIGQDKTALQTMLGKIAAEKAKKK